MVVNVGKLLANSVFSSRAGNKRFFHGGARGQQKNARLREAGGRLMKFGN
jgi:hypothetical protein